MATQGIEMKKRDSTALDDMADDEQFTVLSDVLDAIGDHEEVKAEWSESYSLKFDLYEDQNNDTLNTTTQPLPIGTTANISANDDDGAAAPSSPHKADKYITDRPDLDDEEDDIDTEQDNDQHSCRECLCFLLFFILFTAMAIFSIGNSDYNFTQTSSIRKSLVSTEQFYGWNTVGEKTFGDASTIADIYNYLRQVLIPFLLNEPREVNASTAYYVQNVHVLLGGIRLRQIRQKVSQCDDEYTITWNDTQCFVRNQLNRDMERFYNAQNDSITYEYIDSSVLLDQKYRGKFGIYPGGGYIVDLPLNINESIQSVDELEEYGWIDDASLFLSIDFNVYNPSVSLHTVVRLSWEMQTAGIFSNDEMKTWKFDRYYGETSGLILFLIQVLFFLFVVVISGTMIVDIYRYYDNKGKYKHFWNVYRVMDMINLVIFYMTIALFVHNERYQKSLIDLYDFKAPFESFRRLQALSQMEAYFFAINGFLLSLKLFKYLSFHPKFKFLFFMLQRGVQDIIMFILILFVFYLAFAVSGFVMFSSDVSEYRSYGSSIVSMNLAMMTEMNYSDLVASSNIFGSFYYFMWLIWMTFILMNVFIAILIDSYAKTQVEIELNEGNAMYFNVFEKGREYVRQLKLAQIMSRFEAMDEDDDDMIDVNEIAKALKLDMNEAQRVMEKYDKDGNGVLDRKEFERLKQRLIREKMDETPVVYMKDESLKEHLNEVKYLLNQYLQIDPVGKRVLKKQKGQ